MGGGGEEFQAEMIVSERVRRSGGGEWCRESIQVADECVRCRRPKCEFCHVKTRREWLGVPGRGGEPRLARLVQWLGKRELKW